jgi:hypothetical protein
MLRRPRRQGRRRILKVLDRELDGRVPGERRAAGEHLVEHDADAVHVGGGGAHAGARLLGRHVARRADDRGRPPVAAALGQPRHPEVRDLDPAVGRDQDVGRLDVAVDQPAGVRRRQRLRELLGDPARLRHRWPAAAQAACQALALDQLGHVVEALGRGADVEDLHDPGVADRSQELGLALEAPHPVGILGPPRLDHLDRHLPRQTAVAAPVDAAE